MKKINLNKILVMQLALDKHIEQNHNLKSNDLILRKKLALIVELAELCNEVKCFKYWSNKKASPEEVILDEYVDCLHFILSIALFYKIDKIELEIDELESKKNNNELSIFFIQLINQVNEINNEKEVFNFIKLFFKLGLCLNLTFDKIIDSYYKKNEINYLRQKNNY